MSLELKGIYQFSRFRLDADDRVLYEGDKIVPLPPKLFETLLVLVERQGRIIEKDELMSRVWPDSFVEENNLNKNISVLRKVLGNGKDGQVLIETIPKRGYRFVAQVQSVVGEDELIVATRTSTHVVIEEEGFATDRAGREDASYIDGEFATLPVPVNVRMRRARRLLLVSALAVTILAAMGGYALWPKRAVSATPIKSIAVLPFKPLVAGAQDELFEMGMSETLINRLSGIRAITVRPMSAVRKYSSLEQDPIAAGQEQRVDGVLEGTIQKTGEGIRVTVRLIGIKDGNTLWAEKFDARLTDIFALQDSISERITSVMAVKLNEAEKELLTRHHTEDAEAYRLYLKGKLFLTQGSEESTHKALEAFDQAIARDPSYALAYVGKANVYAAYSSQYFVPAEAMPRAKAEVLKALKLDEELAEAHHSLARIKQWYDWDRRGAELEFQRAIEFNPNYAEAHVSYGGFLTQERRFDECLDEYKRAQELDPLSLSILFNRGYMFYFMREYDKAIAQFQEALTMSPNFEAALKGIGVSYREKGRYAESLAALKRTVELKRLDHYLSELGCTYALAGDRNEAMKLIWELEGLSKQRYVSPYRFASVYVSLGETEKVFEWLNKAYADRSDHLLNLGVDPVFDRLREDPRFKEMLRKIFAGS